ncbi:MAG: PAS domain S-box protein [Leptospiraceae bacterium]|nr:PAS domain S-box protein [Leptospiraceae bacterium]
MKTASILIVEDEALVGIDLRNQLQKFGYVVQGVVGSGNEAIQFVNDKTPEIVLMDINLHGDLTGIQTAKHLMDEHQIPVIYLTAYSDEHTIEEALNSNPFGYLLKPYVPKEIHTTIQTALNRIELEKRNSKLANSKPSIEKLQYIQKNIQRRQDIESKYQSQVSSLEKLKILSKDYFYKQPINNTSKNFINIEEYSELLGYTRGEIINMGSLSIPLLVHKEDLDKFTSFLDRVVNSNGDIIELEFRLKHKNGTWVWILNRSMIDFDSKNKKQIISIVKDISEKKNFEQSFYISENKFRALNNNPYQGIAVLDLEGNIMEINSTLELMTGYKKEELNVLNHSDYISLKGVKLICPELQKIKNKEIESFQIETMVFPKKHGSLWVYMVFTPVLSMENKIKFIICNLSDISETKLLERNDLGTYMRKEN